MSQRPNAQRKVAATTAFYLTGFAFAPIVLGLGLLADEATGRSRGALIGLDWFFAVVCLATALWVYVRKMRAHPST